MKIKNIFFFITLCFFGVIIGKTIFGINNNLPILPIEQIVSDLNSTKQIFKYNKDTLFILPNKVKIQGDLYIKDISIYNSIKNINTQITSLKNEIKSVNNTLKKDIDSIKSKLNELQNSNSVSKGFSINNCIFRIINKSIDDFRYYKGEIYIEEPCSYPLVYQPWRYFVSYDIVFSDNFRNLQKWARYGWPYPIIVRCPGSDDGYCIDPNGDSWYGSGVISRSKWNLESHDVWIIEFKAKVAERTYCWNGLIESGVGFVKGIWGRYPNQYTIGIATISITSTYGCWGGWNGDYILFQIAGKRAVWKPYDHKWHIFKIVLTKTGHVEFYMDGEKVAEGYVPKKYLPKTFYVGVSGRSAFNNKVWVDWIRLYYYDIKNTKKDLCISKYYIYCKK